MHPLAPNSALAIYLLSLVAASLDMIPLEIIHLVIIHRWFRIQHAKKWTRSMYLVRIMTILAALIGLIVLYLLGILSSLPIFLLCLVPCDIAVITFPYTLPHLLGVKQIREETSDDA